MGDRADDGIEGHGRPGEKKTWNAHYHVSTIRSERCRPSGRIRKLMRSFGSDDSAYYAFEYYDEAGHLRFVFATRGAAPTDSKDEFRA
jgi:hypothetical protein